MYAIRNKITGQWLYGTDFREYPYKQRISNSMVCIFRNKEYAEYQFKKRDCNKDYEIVEIE